MWSAEDFAATKVAVELCNSPKLMGEIFCSPGSLYTENRNHNGLINKYDWTFLLRRNAVKCLEKLELPKGLQDKVEGIIHSVALRMLFWVIHHESVLGISREFCVRSLRSSFFTSYGIIDSRKAAEVLINDANFCTEQKFKIACLYLFSCIPFLYDQLQREHITILHDHGTRQPKLYSIWLTAMAMNDSEKEEFLKSCLLEESIAAGSLPAVVFCIDNTIYNKNKSVVQYALETVKNWVNAKNNISSVFGQTGNVEKLWIPRECYVDILCYLLQKMSKQEKILFLKKDLSSRYENDEDQIRSRVLEMFLDFPYQNNFMPTVKLMWNSLTEENYAILLLDISDRIEAVLLNSFYYGAGKRFDYRKLLTRYWMESPDPNRRNVLNNKEVDYVDSDNEQVKAKTGERLFHNLIRSEDYTSADEHIISMILASSTEAEKQNIISPDDWNICLELIYQKKWRVLHMVLASCFDSNEKEKEFKRAFYSANENEIKNAIINFIADVETPGAAEFLMNWIGLSVGDVNQLKRDMINSVCGRKVFLRLINYVSVQRATSFIEWFNLSCEEIAEFKEKIIYSQLGVDNCVEIFTELDSSISLKRMCDFIIFCLSSEEAVREFKKIFFEKEGCYVLENLISDCSVDDVYDEEGEIIASKVSFYGGRWEKVENFITWYSPSREEIRDFKKKELLKTSGAQIHFNLIFAGEFEQAEKFFCWLGLSEKEIKELKKETLYSCEEATELLSDMIYNDIFEFTHFGSNREATETFLQWYLTDEESVLEFRDLKYKFCREIGDDEAVLNNLDMIAEQLLMDLKNKKKE